MQTDTAAPSRAGDYREVPIAALIASKTNPRTHFDDTYIGELAGSIREKGLIQPIIVRPAPSTHVKGAGTITPAGYEIVAGECRFRASKLAQLATLPVIVRQLTDAQVLEAQLEENIHRKDLTPLEEAAGYRRLIASNPDKHSAESIATRIGMSVGYVWDRLKLNDLVPEAKVILEEGRVTVGHAILLARLKPTDQTRAISVADVHNEYRQRDGLWRTDTGFAFDEDAPGNKGKKPGPYDGLKPCSVRELESWIRDHVRFDVQHAAQAQPFEFGDTAQRVEQVQRERVGRQKKVVAITHSYCVADDARDDKERTYGAESWCRADGQQQSKTCDHSVLGVVAAGEGYGSTLEVCVARDKCRVHFGDVLRAKEKAAKARERGDEPRAKKAEVSWEEQQRREREKREVDEKRWKVFHAALNTAVGEKLRGLKALNGPQYAAVLKYVSVPAGTKPADLPKALFVRRATETLSRGSWFKSDMVAVAKLLGVDVDACEPNDKAAAAPAKKTAKKAAKKR